MDKTKDKKSNAVRAAKQKAPSKTQTAKQKFDGQRKPKRKTLIRKVMTLLLICVFTFSLAIVGAVVLIYNSQSLSPEKLENSPKSLSVYSANADLIEDQNEFRHTNLASVNDYTRWAFICTEDKNFYTHHGISIPRIIKATYNNMKSGYAKEGASTISQQLIKNTHLSHEKTIQRKIREAVLAYKLENKYNKDQILEMYFNAVYFGNGVYGLEGASNYYFGKTAKDLNLREAASLAGLIRSPARYCPISNFDKFCKRGDLVLSLMKNQKRITQAEYDEAMSQTMQITAAVAKKQKNVAGSYKTAATAEAAKILNLSAADITAFGYKIHTYFDPEVQNAIADTVSASDYKIKTVSGTEADKCIIAAKPNGEIAGYYISTPTLRSAKRNFASALKPLTVYAPALELGVITPSTVIIDEDFTAGDFHPNNHDGKYHGAITVRESIEQSYNIPAVKVLDYTRLNRAVDVAKNLGLNLTDDENLSLALGNTKEGTTFNELIGGYCTLANGGIKTRPTFIKKIEDRDGHTVYENIQTETRVLGEDTCWLLVDMMRTGAKNGTAKALRNLPFDIAAKTGTCERAGDGSNTDAVNCSVTNDYVLLVWTGNADMMPQHDLPHGSTGGGVTSFIARDIQETISAKAAPFKTPASVEQCEIDLTNAENGQIVLATSATPKDKRSTEYFAKRFKPTKQSTNYLKPLSPTVNGKISDTGAPMIYFNASAHQVYEIYKKEGKVSTLQEVIRSHSGEYIYLDSRAAKGKTYEYYTVTYLKNLPEEKVTSNTVKLYTSSDINKNSTAAQTKKKDSGKLWFF